MYFRVEGDNCIVHYTHIPSLSIIVTTCVSEMSNVNASLGVTLSTATEKSWSPSRTLSSVVGMITQSLRGNAVPSVNGTVYVPSVKSVESAMQCVEN